MIEGQRVEDTLEAYLPRRGSTGHTVYLSLLVLVAGAVAVLPVIRVQVSVAAPGIVRPVAEKQEGRAKHSGVVEGVMASRGEWVREGQPIVLLRTGAIVEHTRALTERETEVAAQIRDLEWLVALDGSPLSLEATLRSGRYRAEYAQLRSELSDHEVRYERARVEHERTAALVERQLLPQRDLDDRTFELRQLTVARELLLARWKAEWRHALTELRGERSRLDAQIDEAEEELSSLTARAPASGTLEEMPSIAPGSFLQAGEVIAVVSPDTTLLAEVYVHPAEVGLLRQGMPVRIHVDALPFQDWGPVPGTLVELSEDYVMVGDEPAFRVVVRPQRDRLSLANGATASLRKGMTLQARFRIADRSLLQILRDDVNDWLHPWHFSAAEAPARR